MASPRSGQAKVGQRPARCPAPAEIFDGFTARCTGLGVAAASPAAVDERSEEFAEAEVLGDRVGLEVDSPATNCMTQNGEAPSDSTYECDDVLMPTQRQIELHGRKPMPGGSGPAGEMWREAIDRHGPIHSYQALEDVPFRRSR